MKHDASRPESSPKVARRHVLIGAGALAAVGALPGPAAGRPARARSSPDCPSGCSRSIRRITTRSRRPRCSATSSIRCIDVTNDSKFVPALAESWTPVNNTDLAVHPPQGRHVPRRHALQRGQRGLHPQARAGQHEADQVLRLPGHRRRARRTATSRSSVTTKRPVRLAARRTSRCWACCRPDAAGERGGVLPEADRDRPLPVRELDPRRDISLDGEPELLEAGHPEGREGHLPLHPGALHPRGRPCARARST